MKTLALAAAVALLLAGAVRADAPPPPPAAAKVEPPAKKDPPPANAPKGAKGKKAAPEAGEGAKKDVPCEPVKPCAIE
jgi:hypothetical protein